MKKVVLSLGGSLIVPQAIEATFLRAFRDLILSLITEFQFIIYAGGGGTARLYQEGARQIGGMSDEQLDWIGIHASRLNAELLWQLFSEHASSTLLIDPTVAVTTEKSITIGAGWKPGWSTDYDAVAAAVTSGIDRVVNLSNIDYVYSGDPRISPDAQPIPEMTWQAFRKLLGKQWKPGLHVPFDPKAAELAEQHSLTVVIADGRDLANVRAILEEREWRGTQIHPSLR